MKKLRACFAALSIGVMLASPVQAQVQAPIQDASCTLIGGSFSQSNICNPTQLISFAHINVSDQGQPRTLVGNTLTYYYQIASPTNQQVSVGLDFILDSYHSGGRVFGSARLSVEHSGSTPDSSSTSIQAGLSPTIFGRETGGRRVVSTPGEFSFMANTNTPYAVTLQSVISWGDSFHTGEAWAFADPRLSLDSVLYPDAVLQFSSGVLNVTNPDALPQLLSAVPEPSITWMSLAGLLVLAGVARSRRQRAD